MENILYVFLHDIRKSSSGMEIERSRILRTILGAVLAFAMLRGTCGLDRSDRTYKLSSVVIVPLMDRISCEAGRGSVR